jgi:hypothetical protein
MTVRRKFLALTLFTSLGRTGSARFFDALRRLLHRLPLLLGFFEPGNGAGSLLGRSRGGNRFWGWLGALARFAATGSYVLAPAGPEFFLA